MTNLSIIHNYWDTNPRPSVVRRLANAAQFRKSMLSIKAVSAASYQDSRNRFAEKLAGAFARAGCGKYFPLTGENLLMKLSAARLRMEANVVDDRSHLREPKLCDDLPCVACPTLASLGS